MSRRAVIVSCLAAAIACGALCSTAGASAAVDRRWEVTLTIPKMDPQPDAAVLLFQNTGGAIKFAESKSESLDAIAVNGDEITIDFMEQLGPGTVTFNFGTVAAPQRVEFVSGEWRSNDAPAGPVSAAHVAVGKKVPALGPSGLALFALLSLGSGAFVIARRRTARA